MIPFFIQVYDTRSIMENRRIVKAIRPEASKSSKQAPANKRAEIDGRSFSVKLRQDPIKPEEDLAEMITDKLLLGVVQGKNKCSHCLVSTAFHNDSSFLLPYFSLTGLFQITAQSR